MTKHVLCQMTTWQPITVVWRLYFIADFNVNFSEFPLRKKIQRMHVSTLLKEIALDRINGAHIIVNVYVIQGLLVID